MQKEIGKVIVAKVKCRKQQWEVEGALIIGGKGY